MVMRPSIRPSGEQELFVRAARAAKSLRSAFRWRLIRLAVHADAFRYDPRKYLQAWVWYVRGWRVRAANQFSALGSHSPLAYDLWIARDEPEAMEGLRASLARPTAEVIPVIDCRDSCAGLEGTLAAIARAGSTTVPIMIGGPADRQAIRVEHPHEIAEVIGRDIWLCPIWPGDLLAVDALKIYGSAAAQAVDTSVIYADDDLVGPNCKRRAPHFKPDWNPELFQQHDFITGAAVVRVSVENLKELPTSGWAKAMIVRGIERSPLPLHLPVVLHHRCDRPTPIIPAKASAPLPDPVPLVTIIIPTRNRVALLRDCVAGVYRTKYPKLETIIVDNGSDEPETLAYLEELESHGATVLRLPGPFNYSALNNHATTLARGEVLCFLNNDIEMLDPDWLAPLVRQALRPELGAIGARLLYSDGRIQHAGLFVGICDAAGHGHRLQPSNESGYFERARLPQRVSAVTGACLVVERQKFLAVGGFDEREFPVAFNDVDLCLKLTDKGWASFYEPRSTLIHHESKSRGSDREIMNRDRFAAELDALRRKWHTHERHDPYHHPWLSRSSEQFLISI